MKAPLVAGALAGALLSVSYAHAYPTECDLLTTHPDDPQRVAPGLEREEIDLPRAERACRTAIAVDPRHARSHYLLGRALFYQGKTEEGTAEVKIAADIGYPQAIFVLGYITSKDVRKSDGDDCRAGELWLRSAALEHPWSGFHLVDKAVSGGFTGCSFRLGAAELERYMRLAEDNITIAASVGRVEALRAKLNAAQQPDAAKKAKAGVK